METNRLRFRLETPCEANWDNMLPADKGRFCLLCQKKVIDFASMTDNEIRNFFNEEKKTDYTCGQFTLTQLSSGIEIKNESLTHLVAFRKIAVITILGLSITGQPFKVTAQGVIEEIMPAEYQEVTHKILLPERYEEIDIPAEYTTIQKSVIVKRGGYSEWREMSCNEKEDSEISVSISAIQQVLTEKGFYKGDIDNVWGEATRKALMAFKQKNGLAISEKFDDKTLLALGILK